MIDINSIVEDLGGSAFLEKRLHLCMRWIEESFRVHDYRYSSGTRTMLGKWGAPYLETTGYLLSTLSEYENRYSSTTTTNILELQLASLLKLQNENGSFPQSLEEKEPIVFDTAQLLLGLITVSSRTNSQPKKALKAIKKSMEWLKENLDHDGSFIAHNYLADYNPLYYSRIAWALIQAEMIIESKGSPEAKAFINLIADKVSSSEDLKNWGLHPDQPALTHNIAYTLRGIWECAEILNDKKLFKLIKKKLNEWIERIEEQPLAGSYSANWEADHSFICVTGHAQMCLLYLLAYDKTQKQKYLQPVSTLLKPLIKSQNKLGLNKGAVPSSIPIYGKYQRFKYTNWTQKFYADTLLQLLKLHRNAS